MAARKRAAEPKTLTIPADLREIVRETIRSAHGLRPADIKKQLPTPYQAFDKTARTFASELADAGEVHRVKVGTSFWLFGDDPLARLDRLVPELVEEPLTESGLKAALQGAGRGYQAVLKDWLPAAVRRRVVFLHAPAPGTRGKRFGASPDFGGLLAPTIKALLKVLPELDAQGITRQQIAETLLEPLGLPATNAGPSTNGVEHRDARSIFLGAVGAVKAQRPGQALLSLKEVRARSELDKATFDATALQLSRDGSVTLHRHDHPASLTEAERAELVSDDRGSFFIGVAPRSEG
ncbi:MAG: hypothetical protein M3020_04990 [Myxococcota bacterium]|nr:hypothetical protein [Myxococcota bacterium]